MHKKIKEIIVFSLPWSYALILYELNNQMGFKHTWIWFIFPIIISFLIICIWYDEWKNPELIL